MNDESDEVFPACAGMILRYRFRRGVRPCVPRMRGDDPDGASLYEDYIRCSPHARG